MKVENEVSRGDTMMNVGEMEWKKHFPDLIRHKKPSLLVQGILIYDNDTFHKSCKQAIFTQLCYFVANKIIIKTIP